MNRPAFSHAQQGATLVVGLIMLVLITLMVSSAFTLSTTNLKSVGNMQFRNEALAAANIAIEQKFGSFVTVTSPVPVGDQILVDINNDDKKDYLVTIATPVCVRASRADIAVTSSEELGEEMSKSDAWNTVWDVYATVTPTSDNPVASGTKVDVHAGLRLLYQTSAEKNKACL